MDIKIQVRAALADMGSKVGRDSKHVYRNDNGDMLQGVSTVSSIVPKDWLAAWGAKEAVRFLGYSDYEEDTSVAHEMLGKLQGISVPNYMKLLKEAKGASMRKKKQALIDGKIGHQWLEDFVKAHIEGSTLPLIPIGVPLERPLKQFLVWEEENVDYWIASEGIVCNLEKRYGGQFDAVAMLKTGELTIIDFKFATNVSEEYYLQTAGYQACFEPYNIKFDKRIIIRLPKTLEKEEWDEKKFKYFKVPNNVEVQVVPTKYEADRDAFYAALIVKGWVNSVTK